MSAPWPDSPEQVAVSILVIANFQVFVSVFIGRKTYYLSVCPCVSPSASLYPSLSIYIIYIHPSVCLSVCLSVSIHVCFCLFLCLSHLSLSIFHSLSFSQYVCLCCLSVHLSVCLLVSIAVCIHLTPIVT